MYIALESGQTRSTALLTKIGELMEQNTLDHVQTNPGETGGTLVKKPQPNGSESEQGVPVTVEGLPTGDSMAQLT